MNIVIIVCYVVVLYLIYLLFVLLSLLTHFIRKMRNFEQIRKTMSGVQRIRQYWKFQHVFGSSLTYWNAS